MRRYLENPDDPDRLELLIIPFILTITMNLWGRAVDGVTGALMGRPRWRRVLLFYKPMSKTAGLFQVAFWLFPMVLATMWDDADDTLALLIAILVSGMLWWSAVHLDRVGDGEGS